MSSKIAFEGLSAARSRLQVLADGLRDTAGGGVLARAAAKVQAQIDAVSKQKLEAHQETGAALSTALTTASGGLVQLATEGYLRFHGWWPFRRGMPPFVVKRASKILAAEFLLTVGAGGSGAAFDAANEVVEEGVVEEAKSAERKVRAAKRRRFDAKQRRVKKLYAKTRKAPAP